MISEPFCYFLLLSQLLNAVAGATEGFLFAQHSTDLDTAAGSKLFAADGNPNRPQHVTVLHTQLCNQIKESGMDVLHINVIYMSGAR